VKEVTVEIQGAGLGIAFGSPRSHQQGLAVAYGNPDSDLGVASID
jgi:hypothetical protein